MVVTMTLRMRYHKYSSIYVTTLMVGKMQRLIIMITIDISQIVGGFEQTAVKCQVLMKLAYSLVVCRKSCLPALVIREHNSHWQYLCKVFIYKLYKIVGRIK